MIAADQNTSWSQSGAQGMLQSIAEAICDRPGDTAVQRDARSRNVIHTTLGFQPRDPVEIMLAGLAVTHAHLVEDSARDVFRGQDDRLKARTKSTIVALDRGMLGFLKELQAAQTRLLQACDVVKPGLETIADAAPPPVGPLDKAAADLVKPVAPNAAKGTPAGTKTPKPPAGMLPPLRRAETSVAAAMAVLSPPMPPYLVFGAAEKPVAAAPPGGTPGHGGAGTHRAAEISGPLAAASGAASEYRAVAERRGATAGSQAA